MEENPFKASQVSFPSNDVRRGPRAQAREHFGVVVRGIGLLTIAMSVWENASGLIATAPGYTRMDYVFSMLPGVVVGGLLLLSADAIAAFSYRGEYLTDDDTIAN